jgi:predicted O-linked N-acetylglucosamine transferase (SPINDLY family)
MLWLLDPGAAQRAALAAEAAQRGIAADRLVWAPRLEMSQHLARLRNADLFVDTWPCNAHTTASDALWAGVPLVTLMGKSFAPRVAASLLHAVGLPQLACSDAEHYVRTVLGLARDVAPRAALRAHLERARDEAPLFDSLGRTRDLEQLYARMWAARLAGAALDHLPAAS